MAKNPKEFLHDWLGRQRITSVYDACLMPGRSPKFKCEVKVPSYAYVGIGISTNKRDAATNAARDFVNFLTREGKIDSASLPFELNDTFVPRNEPAFVRNDSGCVTGVGIGTANYAAVSSYGHASRGYEANYRPPPPQDLNTSYHTFLPRRERNYSDCVTGVGTSNCGPYSSYRYEPEGYRANYHPPPSLEHNPGPINRHETIEQDNVERVFPKRESESDKSVELIDLTDDIHGGWTLNNCDEYLHDYARANQLPLNYQFSETGPNHNRSYCCEISFYVKQLGKNIGAREHGFSRSSASLACDFSLTRQLYQHGLIVAYDVWCASKQFKESKKKWHKNKRKKNAIKASIAKRSERVAISFDYERVRNFYGYYKV